MEDEPVPPPLASLPDSAMTIDYETDPLNATLAASGGGNEEMGDDDSSVQPPLPTSNTTTEPVVEEAEMADDEASTWEKDQMVEEGNSIDAIPAPPTEVDLTDNETLPEVTGDPTTMSTSMEETTLPAPTEIEEPASSSTSLPLPLPLPLPTSSELLPPSTTAEESSALTTNGISHEEPTEDPAAPPAEVPLSEGEQADAEQSDYPETLKTTSTNEEKRDLSNVNLTDDLAPSPFLRPQVDKASLIGIEVPFPEPQEGEPSTSQQAPTILCTYDNTTYSLFRSQPKLTPAQEVSSEGGAEPQQEDEDETPTLLTDAHDQQFYFGTLEQLFSKLHDQFPELQSREDELVLDFDEIGVALTEDNVYSRQVSLHDFDRIHLGCGLPGRLHARLYPQSRFSSGFNALAQHVANSMNGISVGTEAEGEGDDSEVTYDQGEDEEDGTINGDEDYPDESFVTVGEPEDQEADGPDSQLPREENEGEEEGEEFDLESALAQLDGDDVVAYAEGAAEDYILSEVKQGEEGEETNEGEQEANEENTNEERNEGEEVEVTAVIALEGGEVEKLETIVGEKNGAGEANEEGSKEEGQVEEIQQVPESVESEQNGVVSNEVDTTAGDVRPEDVVDAATNAEDNIQESTFETEAPVEIAQTEDPTSVEDPSTTVHVFEPEASALGESAIEATQEIPASETVETGNETATAIGESATIDEAIDPNDVVIDYDEAFDGSSSAVPPTSDAPVEAEQAAATQASEEAATTAPHSPKRRHDSLDAGLDEVAENEIDGNDAKRPRLEDSSTTSTA